MRFLRTNTAVIITVGPFIDKTDGLTPKTALTATNEKITLAADTDAGSAPTLVLDITGAGSGTSNDFVHITGDDAGLYSLELAAADTNRFGRMILAITDATNHLPVFHEFMVLPAMIYDSFILGTDVLDSSMTQILGSAVSTPATAGILDVNVKNIDNDAASASGTVTFPNATLASTTNVTAVAAAVWDLDATAHQTQGTFGQAIGDPTTNPATIYGTVDANLDDTITNVLTAVSDESTVIQAAIATVQGDTNDIQTRLPAALVGGLMPSNLTAAGLQTDAVNEIADGVWDEATAGHVTAGTTGKALIDAGAAGTPPTAAAIADAVWDELLAAHVIAGSAGEALGAAGVAADPWIGVAETTFTYGQLVRIIAAAVAGKVAGAPDSPVFRNVSDDTDMITGTVDSSGNRTSATYGS